MWNQKNNQAIQGDLLFDSDSNYLSNQYSASIINTDNSELLHYIYIGNMFRYLQKENDDQESFVTVVNTIN